MLTRLLRWPLPQFPSPPVLWHVWFYDLIHGPLVAWSNSWSCDTVDESMNSVTGSNVGPQDNPRHEDFTHFNGFSPSDPMDPVFAKNPFEGRWVLPPCVSCSSWQKLQLKPLRHPSPKWIKRQHPPKSNTRCDWIKLLQASLRNQPASGFTPYSVWHFVDSVSKKSLIMQFCKAGQYQL